MTEATNRFERKCNGFTYHYDTYSNEQYMNVMFLFSTTGGKLQLIINPKTLKEGIEDLIQREPCVTVKVESARNLGEKNPVWWN